MADSEDVRNSRTLTNDSLRTERERSDEEVLARSDSLAEDSEEIIRVARERARLVLDLARTREDQHLRAMGVDEGVRDTVDAERKLENDALAAERASADAQRLDERELRRLAIIQLLAHERAATDHMLAEERGVSDRSAAAREDLLAIIAHDLRSMLSAILINASVVLMAPDLKTANAQGANIQRAGAKMAQLLDDLLDAARVDVGRLALNLAPVNVVELAEDAVEIHQMVATANGVELWMKKRGPVVATADGRRLTRVLVNVIGNALKFTDTGGTIEVGVDVDDGECEISVRDTGIGIPVAELETIFERFQQLAPSPHQSIGAGLGLYIARRIVEAHGGRIWVESVEGSGSTFRIRIPIRAAGAVG